jgi:VWFA-related protein
VAFGEEEIPVKPGLTAIALTALLSLNLSPAVSAQQTQPPAPVPDAPVPQKTTPLADAGGPIRPGSGAGTESTSTGSSGSGEAVPTPPPANAPAPKQEPQGPPPDFGNAEQLNTTIVLNATYVDLPVTVKDNKGKLVAGLTWRDFKVYENGNPEPLKFFTVDPFPLSIAFVVDQSVTSDVMAKVNSSLGAIQAALTPYDELAVFTYSNGAQDRSNGFTGAQSTRVPFVLSMTKAAGSEMVVPVNDGPFASCNIRQNGNCVDPNLQSGRSAGNGTFVTIPKEIHTLNDAILAAAKELSTRPKGRRRIIYVISDGKENGSKATYKDVLHYLQQNKIAVYGTLVGDSARWGEGYVSRIHLPFTMYDNRLANYVLTTGGTLDSERNLSGIEKSYAEIANEARNQYTLVYASHEPLIDGKFRSIDVRVDRPGLEVITKKGYYPAAVDNR